MGKSVFEKQDTDIDLGNGIYLRWIQRKDGPIDSALIMHPVGPENSVPDEYRILPGICIGGISFTNDPDAGPGKRDTWQFDGDFEKPTLSPSILCGCGFHGWVRNGKWEDA